MPNDTLLQLLVAPYVGAWIETSLYEDACPNNHVAPYVGAWIETCTCLSQTNTLAVAPYVGAWIETNSDVENP